MQRALRAECWAAKRLNATPETFMVASVDRNVANNRFATRFIAHTKLFILAASIVSDPSLSGSINNENAGGDNYFCQLMAAN